MGAINITGADREIYLETLSNCQASRKSIIKTILNGDSLSTLTITTGQTLDNLFVHPDAEKVKEMLHNNGLGIYASDRLNSMGFILALEECFSDSPNMKKAYVISFLAADTIAKIPAIFSSMIVIKGSLTATGWLKKSLPKAYIAASATSALGIAYLSIKGARDSFLGDQLSPEENQRVKHLSDNIKEGLKLSAEGIISEGQDVIAALEEKLATTTDPKKAKAIRLKINEIQANLEKLTHSI